MGALLAEWGLEILFGLISMGIFGYAKMTVAKVKKELEESKKEAAAKEKQALEATIDVHLEPVYEELEELRRYIRDTENIEKSHMSLIIASYRFRLIQLCKAFLKQGFMTPEQMEQLFPYAKQALENTHQIAQRCEVTIEFGNYKLPKFDVPNKWYGYF